MVTWDNLECISDRKRNFQIDLHMVLHKFQIEKSWTFPCSLIFAIPYLLYHTPNFHKNLHTPQAYFWDVFRKIWANSDHIFLFWNLFSENIESGSNLTVCLCISAEAPILSPGVKLLRQLDQKHTFHCLFIKSDNLAWIINNKGNIWCIFRSYIAIQLTFKELHSKCHLTVANSE